MYKIEPRYTDPETGYLETATELQADTFSVLYCAAGRARYHVEDFSTREEAEEYIRFLEEEESENN